MLTPVNVPYRRTLNIPITKNNKRKKISYAFKNILGLKNVHFKTNNTLIIKENVIPKEKTASKHQTKENIYIIIV